MARVKRGTMKNKHRKNILAQTKGYRFGRKSKERVAKEAIHHAGVHAFRDRKTKKRLYRQVFSLRINAAARESGFSYSKLIGALKRGKVALDRKSLSSLAMHHPEVFARVLQQLAR